MTVMIDWDAYRSDYGRMSYAEHLSFYDRVWAAYPVQIHFDLATAIRFFERTKPQRVLELGGWRGELAGEILSRFPSIERWENLEICRGAAQNTVVTDGRYSARTPTTWAWIDPSIDFHAFDTFVGSHVIEHMDWEQVTHLFDRLRSFRALFLASPLRDDPFDWKGYVGSHVLRMGWSGITHRLATQGWSEIPCLTTVEVRAFERSDDAPSGPMD